ncbi:MAG: ribonuclease HII [Nitrospirae bacterium]|nr:ribonuclease HII [Nitrospirota bacterium]
MIPLGQKKGINSIFSYDEEIRKNYPLIAGLDEAGRGPLAGPVVAAAVILPGKLAIDGLRDSKKVLEDERERLFWDILCGSLDIGVGIVESDIIDGTNILRATKLAMEMAIKELNRKPDILLIDAVRLQDVSIPQKSIIKGESVSASIAAASIIAKVVRDSLMRAYHEKYPLYNFMEHKGYSTRQHIECLRLHGPCPIHRKSFRKVMDMGLPFKE